MRRFVQTLAVASCVMMLCCAPAPKKLTEDEKIERLIQSVDQLKDATFVRNGKDYDCHAAAKHMRDKWEHGKDQIKTASDFIEKAASKSITSGKPYLIRFKDGREVESGTFLRDELKKIEGEDSPPSR